MKIGDYRVTADVNGDFKTKNFPSYIENQCPKVDKLHFVKKYVNLGFPVLFVYYSFEKIIKITTFQIHRHQTVFLK